ncbi:Uncharacterized protein SCG7086_BF_00070 [Chlamydiales bacterium SCGC AG-110-P3]|nr:Uncharacterized protein SCG7086_BF_00070 [Chlamydiales bacterium SCGC AG-110-P3]
MKAPDHTYHNRLLVIGDNAINVAVSISDYYTIATASSKSEAIRCLAERPQLVILTTVIENESALNVLASIRQTQAESPEQAIPPVILLLEAADKQALTQAINLRCDDIIIGNYSALELRTRTEMILYRQRARDDLHREVDLLREQSERDPLTHLFNRRAFASHAKRELLKTQRSQQSTTLLILDIDHFKTINDTHGHPVGDEVLVSLSERVRQQLRGYDLIGRHGGDELVILLPHTDLIHSERVCTKLLDAIRHPPFSTRSGNISIFGTIGGATFTSTDSLSVNQTLEALFEFADAALYRAKEEGRNRFRCLEMEASTATPLTLSRQNGVIS